MASNFRLVNGRGPRGEPVQFTVENGLFKEVGQSLDGRTAEGGVETLDAKGAMVLPAGVDAHVHSREPGLTHKETWQTLARGAARGGVTAVADMPNTLPPTMTRAAVIEKAALAEQSGLAFKLLVGVGASNIADVGKLLLDPDLPVCALKVFYGKTTGELMYDDLESLGRHLPLDNVKPIVFHSEDQCGIDCNQAQHAALLKGRSNADFAVHSRIRASETAHASTRVILGWAKSYGRPVHIAHVSTPDEVEMVAEARALGAKVTCEVAPHHLLLSIDDYATLGPLAKMNPPLRTRAEASRLMKLVGLGLVDMFATDHAPHLLSEKRVEVERSPSGVPSIELFYPLVFEIASRSGLSLERAVAMASKVPAGLFGFTDLGDIAPGKSADFTLIDPRPAVVRGEEVVSKCGWTPYDGWQLPCSVTGTWRRGQRLLMT